ncbi:MAG: ATPase, T2SS/T4P/T4SS family [Ktedonobacterales bacterium]
MFDPRSPYHRRMWHYESDRPLSVAQLVALGSLDARTAALLWLLVERHQSLIVSGPTDPTPGVGKTTTLNALLGFLPPGSTLVYTTGMYEDFDFKEQVDPQTTSVLANEVSDHLRIYMWGRVARKLLRLPEEGYAIATSCHADTIEDVLVMLAHDLRLPAEDIRRLGIIVNIGLVGHIWPPRRRFLSVNFVRPFAPQTASAAQDDDDDPRVASAISRNFGVSLLPLSCWDETADGFMGATPEVLAELAEILGMPEADLLDTLDRRTALIERLAAGRGAGVRAMREAVDEFTAAESGVALTAASDEDDDER